jgi:hypothetical protein
VFALLFVLLAVLVAVPAPARAAAPEPKIAVIVGPSGAVTQRHRQRAEAAIAEARQWTRNIAYVASPNATWPAVREALQDASIVIYLGHGNGWPSRYRDHLYPPTQNGFGLNPVAGVDDDAHQYFGEQYIRDEVRLARNAVVLLHHLCYASGNTEPGLPEGTLGEARQRVDNYAAGFIAAGAAAVVADARSGANHYLRALLGGNKSIEDIWRASPSAHGNTFGFASTRSPGHSALMDPDRPDGGYYRSLVARMDVRAGDLRESAPDTEPSAPVATPEPTPPPTLAELGYTFAAPTLSGVPGATGTRGLRIPISAAPAGSLLPEQLYLGVRWDALAVDPEAQPETPPGASPRPPEPSIPADPTPSPTPAVDEPALSRGERPAPTVPPVQLDDPAAAAFVVAERTGDVVTVVPVVQEEAKLFAKVKLPAVPGLYRLVTTLHDSETVAFDSRTQAMLSALVVRVQPLLSATYAAPRQVEARPGQEFRLPVTLTNSGYHPWVQAPDTDVQPRGGAAETARLVATWVPLTGGSVEQAVGASLAVALAPYDTSTYRLQLAAPAARGDYLVMLDVLTAHGSLTANGIAPGIVRVTVR